MPRCMLLSYCRNWRTEAGALLVLALAAALVFVFTPLDIEIMRTFYRAGPDHWPLGRQWPWSVLYQLAPYITASLLIIGTAGLLMARLWNREAWRRNSIFLILCIVIGPGMVINAVFKDHWDRPRPRDIVEFGGTLHYTPAPLRGEGGSSFPCGHCSVGFLYAGGWWMWKRRRPGWARASLALGLLVGTSLGVGRMAAGGHFFSDVIWSGLIALGLAHILYHHILRLDDHQPVDDAVPAVRPVWFHATRPMTWLALSGAVLAALALFVTPHGRPFSTHIDLAALPRPPRALEVSANTANIDIVIGDFEQPQLLADGELHGFGLPGSRLDTLATYHAAQVPTLVFRIDEQGWMTDLSASVTIRLPPAELQRITVRVQRGDIRVTDATRSRVVRSGKLRLDLHTDSGHVQQPREIESAGFKGT
jgi:lipid A 4'-phosphatase